MSLPDHTLDPSATAATGQAPDPSEPRHLHAVHPTEDTTEFPPITADPAPAEPAQTSTEPTEAPETSNPWPARAEWLRAAFTPDSGLYTDRQPAVGEIVRRAKHGSHLPEAGPLRVASKAHGYLAAGNKIAVRTWEWIVDHPARLGVFLALVAVAIAFPLTRHLLGYLLTPVTWAQQAFLD